MKTIKRRAPLTSGWQVVQNTRPINVHQDYHPFTQFGSLRVSMPVIVGTCRNEWLNRLNRPDINKSVAFGSGKSGHVASFSEICLFDTRCINVPKEQNILPVWRSRCIQLSSYIWASWFNNPVAFSHSLGLQCCWCGAHSGASSESTRRSLCCARRDALCQMQLRQVWVTHGFSGP